MDAETWVGSMVGEGVMYYEREKAKSEAQRGKPKGTLESEIRIAMLLLGQRPPGYTGVCRS